MTRRVFLPLLIFGLIAVAAVGFLICSAAAQARTQQLQLQRAAAISHIAERTLPALKRGDLETLTGYLTRFHETYGESVLVVDAAGTTLASVGEIDHSESARAVTLAALRGVPQWSLPLVLPWGESAAYMAEPLSTDEGNSAGAVTLTVNESAAKQNVLNSWFTVGLAGITLLAMLLTAVTFWSRWILKPVQALDAATEALRENRKLEPLTQTGPPELRNLSRSFETMVQSVNAALEQQRGLVADASHQLRNPLAAIRLRIDALRAELAFASPTSGKEGALEAGELAAVDRDLDRLAHTVERMLFLANAEHRANEQEGGRHPEYAIAAPTWQHVSAALLADPSRAALQAARIALIASEQLHTVCCRPGDLDEIVDILLDNASKYAGAGATVAVRLTSSPVSVVIEVSDSGPGLTADELTHLGQRFWRAQHHQHSIGSGLGYAIIEQLTRANGGTYQVGRSREGGLCTRVELRSI